jgi:hypothetical protein
VRSDPAADPPQKIVRGNQTDKDGERAPQRAGMMPASAEHVDQMLDRILRSERTAHSREHAAQDDRMRERVAADIAKKKRKRPVRIARELGVVGIALGDGEMFQLIGVVGVFQVMSCNGMGHGTHRHKRQMLAL